MAKRTNKTTHLAIVEANSKLLAKVEFDGSKPVDTC